MSGCATDIDGRYKGLSIGFNYTYYTHSSIMCAARSDKTEFDVNDVTLDFYFGWCQQPPGKPAYPDIYSAIVYAIYFGNNKSFNRSIQNIEDYKDILDHCFVKEISIEQFDSDEFAISMKKNTGKVFKQSEKYTIPKELFDQSTGYVYFWIRNIWLKEDNQFLTQDGECVSIKYDFINDNIVRLSK